jgi:hypothetical protein
MVRVFWRGVLGNAITGVIKLWWYPMASPQSSSMSRNCDVVGKEDAGEKNIKGRHGRSKVASSICSVHYTQVTTMLVICQRPSYEPAHLRSKNTTI